MSWTIDVDDLPDLARGAAILGTGGGGDPTVGMLLVRAAITEHANRVRKALADFLAAAQKPGADPSQHVA